MTQHLTDKGRLRMRQVDVHPARIYRRRGATQLAIAPHTERPLYANPSTAILSRPFLSTAECDAWLAHFDAQAWQDARVAVPGGADTVDELRRCALAPLTDAAMLARLTATLHELNAAVFAFDAWSFLDADPVVAMRYPVGGHFAWHIDNATAETQSRKLSFTVQLTDEASYDGGDLEFAVYHRDFGGRGDERAQLRARGAITVFPAFQLHRVTPVVRGERTAIVGWFHGPRFR